MADAAKAKSKDSGNKANNLKKPPQKPQQPQRKQQPVKAEDPATNVNGKANASANGGDNEDTEGVAIRDLLENHEKELLDVASDLTAETYRYDAELRQLTVKLDEANRRLLQLERRFPTLALWRIGNFKETFQEARSGRGSPLNSPAYYLSREGYRFAMSICLYGEGHGRGSHIALYVSICRGEFDGCLRWPFALRVYLSILDQTQDNEPRRNLTRVIMPRVCQENRPFLDRPRTERNPRFGFEQFASLEEFVHGGRQYVHDDAVFVKLEVPCEDLPGI